MNQDEQHLDLLSIFHYVVGGITALFTLIILMRESVRGLFAANRVPGSS